MPKELRELLDQINAKKTEVKNFVAENKIEEAKASKEELKSLQDKFDVLYDLYEEEKENNEEAIKNKAKENNKENSIAEFANAARNGFRVNNKMTIGSKPDGGYTVPEDILTSINTYRESKKSLKDLVTVEKVTTSKGSRTFKKRAQQNGFTKVGEGGKIGKGATPQFERLNYEIEKYAGYFPVTNELLADSDANITNTLIQWIGDESRVTANKLILNVIKTKAETKLEGLNGIKKALNVTLGSAFKATSKIITNDDGLQYLDTLKDGNGRYILQADPITPMSMWLCAGATKVPVEVIPNSDMPSTGNKAPFIIGDLKEGIVFWDRQLMSIKMSDIASIGDLNAFEEDLTLFRAIEREVVTKKDEQAFVNGYIDISAP
ncbi:phage major capsid protein [Clostridium sp.]|jgi:HK97 family phage major capsid protein|uniref:phage major capsid protein n=1 Tax=Clostridium sp. TaxID=1506 RepID=UPI002050B9A5|nr:MAG TPA: major capsid protein [Caudoviricetes sp.]